MNIYQEQILDNYKNPRNSGKPDWTPTHTFKLSNLTCGDEVTVYLLIDNKVIKDFKFEAEGCSISIASASLLSEKIIGMELNELSKFTDADLMKILGIELTISRQKCALLSIEAVRSALENQDRKV